MMSYRELIRADHATQLSVAVPGFDADSNRLRAEAARRVLDEREESAESAEHARQQGRFLAVPVAEPFAIRLVIAHGGDLGRVLADPGFEEVIQQECHLVTQRVLGNLPRQDKEVARPQEWVDRYVRDITSDLARQLHQAGMLAAPPPHRLDPERVHVIRQLTRNVPGAVNVVPVGHRPVDGLVYLERDAQATRVVLHEHFGNAHASTSDVNVQDPGLPRQVQAHLADLFPHVAPTVTWSPLNGVLHPEIKIVLTPHAPLDHRHSDLDVARTLLPTMTALRDAIDPHHPSYLVPAILKAQRAEMLDRIYAAQATHETIPTTRQSRGTPRLTPSSSQHRPRSAPPR